MKPAVKPESILLQRRHLMIAGAAAVVVPAGWLFTTRARAALAGASPATQNATSLVASGRVTTADGKPLAGATIYAWYVGAQGGANNEHARVLNSDADGRFVFDTIAPHISADGIAPLHAHVLHPALPDAHHAFVTFGSDHNLPEAVVAQTLLDHHTLRASFSLTVA